MAQGRAAVVIRAETPGDRPAVAAVVTAAFGSGREARLVEAVRASPHWWPELCLVAVAGGRVVGHVMVSGAALVDGAARRPVALLSPLAVDPPAQGRGIGSALVTEVVRRAEAAGEPMVVLEGDPAFYGRLGFEPAAPHGVLLPLPAWAPPEAGQLVRLPGHHGGLRGRVVYPPAFAALAGD